MRLIDADALLEVVLKLNRHLRVDGANHVLTIDFDTTLDLITNAPTIQREGWVSVPIEPTDEMLKSTLEVHCRSIDNFSWTAMYKAMLAAAPTETE